MRHIGRLKLKGFKSIREIGGTESGHGTGGLELGDINLLIGGNGSGKSNFLSFFSLLQAIVSQELQLFIGRSGGASRLLYFGRRVTEGIDATLELGGAGTETLYEWTLVPTAAEGLVFKSGQPEETLAFESETVYWFNPNSYSRGETLGTPSIVDGGRRGSLESEGLHHENASAKAVQECLFRMQPFHPYHFADMGTDSRTRQHADLDDNRSLRPDGANIAPFLYLLKQTDPSAYQRIVETVRVVYPFIDRFVLEPLKLNPRFIQLEWKESGTDDFRDASFLSDGALRFICLATLLLQPNPPGLIVIDEPELGLHPLAIGLLADLMKAAAEQASQLVVATQSVTLVNHFRPEDLIVVERHKEDGSARFETIFKRKKTEAELAEWLEEYTLGDLWEKNLLGGRPAYG